MDSGESHCSCCVRSSLSMLCAVAIDDADQLRALLHKAQRTQHTTPTLGPPSSALISRCLFVQANATSHRTGPCASCWFHYDPSCWTLNQPNNCNTLGDGVQCVLHPLLQRILNGIVRGVSLRLCCNKAISVMFVVLDFVF
jgi:hypothetical protein